ncbi:sensor histidine kinase [Blastococcus sp. Marseille-P5729]|uniref:sensor histidine kinase n=1 Tax=Blastococcus sp. Marseille-P5729 TaxID=2086582 RepID=UPI00131D0BCA|nr:histidine kinase [Blastococcus sp. Marseille-P5729]
MNQAEHRDGASPGSAAEQGFADRFGWLLGGIWVIFLVYPALGILHSDTPAAWKAAGVAVTVAFGVVYVAALAALDRIEAPEADRRFFVFLCLMLLAIVTIPYLGLGALGFVPYLVSYSMLALPRRFAYAVFVLALTMTIVLPAIARLIGDWWFMAIIVMLTGFTTLFVRIMEERETQTEIVKEQLAVVAERERVARDVHDVLGHSLTVVTVKAELAQRLIDVDPDRARSEMHQIQSLTRQALAEVRATVGGLRVARLGDELDLSRDALASAGVRGTVPDDPDVVDPRYRIIFAWALREAITNVIRHSGATECVVSLSERGMTVVDNGIGLGERPAGNGLRGIRERVEAASGRLDIRTDVESGGTLMKVVM